MSSVLQLGIEKKFSNESRVQHSQEAECRASGGKVIQGIQVCIRCRRMSPLKQGRKSCPFCSGLLIVKFMIPKEE